MVSYYLICFILSLVFSIIYAVKWHNNFNILYTLIFIIITIANMGYLSFAMSSNLEEAILSIKITYLGGCYLLMLVMFFIFDMCHIELKRRIKALFFIINTLFYMAVLTIGNSTIFYKNAEYKVVDGVVTLVKEYGFLHPFFYLMMIVLFLLSFAALVYGYKNRPDASIKNIRLLFISQVVSVFSFFIGRMVYDKIEWMPVAYLFDQLVYLIIVNRTALYDVNRTVIDTIVERGDIGFISFDFRMNYLGSNEAAKGYYPILKSLRVDKKLIEDDESSELKELLSDFKENNDKREQITYHEDKYLKFEVGYLYNGRKKRGYQIMITDVTEQEKYVHLLNNYNTSLQKAVDDKTERIQLLQDRLVLGMATMVESRDNSTGGHIRRTSDVVKLLMDEIVKEGIYDVDDDFYKNAIKAAPMHDLGKIAVDDKVLKKPGRFTDEEYEIMKTHAAEGARVVREILKDIEDNEFKKIAENVAHYHHEKWNGKGYPEGLSGTDIPLEARIMAVADVYDALVSKRCYKDSMSYEQAYDIITGDMGTHFDPDLKDVFISVEPKLRGYYSEVADE